MAEAGGHTAHLELEPALPDLPSLASGAAIGGTWELGIDAVASIISGTWAAGRDGDAVMLELAPTAEWRPGRLPLLMRIVTRVVPTFRTWPTT